MMLFAMLLAGPHIEGNIQMVLGEVVLFHLLLKTNADVIKLLGFTAFEWPECGAHLLQWHK